MDQATGEVRDAHLFVTALGASGFGFGKAFWSEDTRAWCEGHIAAFEYFGGAPQLIIYDYVPRNIIWADPCRHTSEMLKGANVPLQEGLLIVPVRKHDKQASGKAQPHYETLELGLNTAEFDGYLAVINLCLLPRSILERNEDRFGLLPGLAEEVGHTSYATRVATLIAQALVYPPT